MRLVLSGLLAMLATCSGAGSDAGNHARSCKVDADCIVVQTACCDHCNGGKLEAFHRDHADAKRAKDCERVPCRPEACEPITATASCNAGICTVLVMPQSE